MAKVARRVDELDWAAISGVLDDLGCSLAGPVLSPRECRTLTGLYSDDGRFRSTIDMARHRFGQGEYRYFDRPLPELVAELRAAFWPHLLPIAREWAGRLGRPAPWPDDLDDWLGQCHLAGQTRPTPLLLRYGPGDWNALHRDLYGELVFPLQVVIGLDRPGVDYTGGEFLAVEQRPRAQSRGTTTVIGQGQGLVFTTRDRPVPSRRGWSAAPMRHGVSVLRYGRRHTLGLVFHDVLSALEAYPKLQPGSSIRGWLVTIAHRKAIDQLRGTARRPQPAGDLPEIPASDAAPAGEASMDDELRAALDALPAKQRGAVIYRYLADLSYAEVGELLESSATAARRSAADGIANLRKHFSKGART